MRTKQKFLSLVLAMCLVMSLLPVTAFAENGDAAQIGETTYATLQEAVTAAESMDGEIFVTLLRDTTERITVSKGNVCLDLAGFEISDTQTTDMIGTVTVTGGNLTIKDSSTEKAGKVLGGAFAVVVQNGNLTVDGGTFGKEPSVTSGRNGPWNEPLFVGGGSCVINDGLFIDGSTEYFYYFEGADQGSLVVNGGRFDSLPYFIAPNQGTAIWAPDGEGYIKAYETFEEFAGENSDAFSYDSSTNTLNMTAAFSKTVTNPGDMGGAFFNADVTLDLNGQTWTLSNRNQIVINGKVEVTLKDSSGSGGMISATGSVGVIETLGSLNIQGGKLQGGSFAIIVDGNSAVNMTDGEISGSLYAIAASDPSDGTAGTSRTINISGGKVTGGQGNFYLTNQYKTTTCTVSGGEFSHPVSLEYCAEGYIPVKEDGVNKVTDGSGYEALIYGYDSSYNLFYTPYATLADAANAVKVEQKLILLKDVTLENNTSLVIQDKNGGTWGWESVTLDLNGHTITGSNSADATGSNAAQSGILTVYGSRVELKDSSANGGGKIVNTADTSGSSVVTVLPSDTYSANLVMGFNYESAVTLENQSTQPTANSGIYVYAPSEGELSAYVVVNDAYIKGGASAVSTSGSDNATLVISGGNYSSSVAEYVSAAKTAELVRASGDMPYSYFTDVAAAQAVAAPEDTINDLSVKEEPGETYYEVKLVYNDEKTAQIVTKVKENGGYTLPSDEPTLSGYTFQGWSDGSGTHAAGVEVTITGNTTFTARWENEKVNVTSVRLDKSSLSLIVGGSETLTATVDPKNATDKDVTWSSSDESVATVSEDGKVTAVGLGTATIKVTTKDGGKTATCTVAVSSVTVPATGITLDQTSLTLYSNAEPNTATLAATVTPPDSTDTVTWVSSNESVATVDKNGVVTVVGNGTATITAKAGGYSAACEVTVKTYSTGGSTTPSAPTYTVTAPSNVKNGTVKVSPARAEKGDTVTITVKPDKGYELDELVVTDKDGDELKLTEKSDNKFTFKMPASKVTVSVSFVKIEEEEPVKPVEPVELPFIDVVESAWYADAVRYVYEKGLMGGSGSAETFQPEAPTTRAMLVTILYRLEGEPAVSGASGYTDVPAGQYYTDAVAWATRSLIVQGYDGLFRPDDTLTRQDLATILYRYASYKGYSVGARADLTVYPDAGQVSDYAVDTMAWANAEELITGLPGDLLAPQSDSTRAVMATILMRFCENVAQ